MVPALFSFSIFLLNCHVIISASHTHHFCSRENSLRLLQFKQSFDIDEQASSSCIPSHPKTNSWNRSTDCCLWDGVSCDERNGEVIGLDLSCSQLRGSIKSNSTLFQLSHLQRLSLAFNDFMFTPIHSNFAGFRNLMHLNLGYSSFSGSVPLEFSHMFNLISLDLASNSVRIKPHVFKSLLPNLTQLKELSLEHCKVHSMLPRNLSDSLESLNLGDTGLFGELPLTVFQLPKLRVLSLAYNYLSGSSFNVNHSTLIYLDLSSMDFSGGQLHESIGNLKSLYSLTLSYCNFSGQIPESLGNLTQVNYMVLNGNEFTGHLPPSLGNLEQLVFLDLSMNSLGGQLPNIFSNFQSLIGFSLGSNLFDGYLPSSITNLTKLESLDVSINSLTGPLPPNILGLQRLIVLSLPSNSFNGTIPSWVFNLPLLWELDMSSNQLTGQLQEFQHRPLQIIHLERNHLHGPIPISFSKLLNLSHLDLSHNNFSGTVDISIFSSLQSLSYLDLSFNSLSLTNNRANDTLASVQTLYLSSCGVKNVDFLIGNDILRDLDLSCNLLKGQIFSHSYTWPLGLRYLNLSYNYLTRIPDLTSHTLEFLDLSSNLLSGPLPMPSSVIRYYFASHNKFTGEIPVSVCNFSSLELLDLCHNNLGGLVPHCLANVSTYFLVLDLHSNNFQGTIPSSFPIGSGFISLNLRDNKLEGRIPESLSRCSSLEVLDLGNNQLDGMFPWWLGTLPNLQVLSLRANYFHGPLTTSETGILFQALRILDLSQNEFTGVVPPRFLNQLKGMKIVNHIIKDMFNDELDAHYESSVLVTTKDMEIDVVHILSIYTTLDLSSNKFHGVIPNIIGNLIAVQGLNLSHNNFGGPIPQTLANLTFLESLDLSSNQIQGDIPQQLAALTYLSFLNLSQNRLVGSIPRGNQFNTFENTSYLGNDGLCGFPLSRTCGLNNPIPYSKEKKDFTDGFTWQAVSIGFGTGILIGMSLGCLIFCTRKPKWFNKFVEECSRFLKKKMA